MFPSLGQSLNDCCKCPGDWAPCCVGFDFFLFICVYKQHEQQSSRHLSVWSLVCRWNTSPVHARPALHDWATSLMLTNIFTKWRQLTEETANLGSLESLSAQAWSSLHRWLLVSYVSPPRRSLVEAPKKGILRTGLIWGLLGQMAYQLN